MDKLSGSCVCQAVKYEIVGEIQGFFLCHCSRCRKVTGSAHGANIFLKVEKITWLSGEDRISHFHLPETRFAKSFCSQCSSALPSSRPNGFGVVPAGSLDSEFSGKPTAHISCASRAKWDDGFADVPQLPALPGYPSPRELSAK